MIALGLVLSLAIGLSLGLLGGGGSILTVPVLHYALGLGVHDAIGASLFVVGVTSSVALVPHARAGQVRWQTGLAFGAASMVTAFAGGRLGALLPGSILIVHAGAIDPELELLGLTVQRIDGPIDDAIVAAARARGACLIAMATRGHDAVGDVLRGSHTERVIREARCPVLSVPDRWSVSGAAVT